MAHSRLTRRMAVVAVLTLLAAVALLPMGAAQAEERQAHPGIWIERNNQFNPQHGVRGGSGTITDPYIISGWETDVIYIKDTDAYVEIFNNAVTNVMVLDWIGDRVYVHDNDVDDLRVNQNVRRKGEATSGVISNNNFEVVGQLRHWDGIFEDNVVGLAPEAVDSQQPWDSVFDQLFDFRAVNFDGFNGAIFRDNTIYGYMDARLHGHHHSSDFGGSSHYHGTDEAASHSMMDMDHSKRYHEVWILNNKIVSDSYYALAYLDTAHSANDRTAASERNEELNKPHAHFTRVHIIGNKLSGAGLGVEIFNARDERHTGTNRGLVELKNNKIALVENEMFPWQSLHGIYARSARDIDLQIVGNVITAEQSETEVPFFGDYGAGIDLTEFDKGDVLIANTSVDNLYYGINAHDFSKTVFWTISDFKTSNVQETVYWDDSVKNPPEQNP
ncbi:MAG: hypothetical protein ABR505_11740 [Actinomycetota bacterium]